jgi:hypothetical protein
MPQDKTVIEHNGRKFEYDADFDVFRPQYTGSISLWDRWGWIIVIVILLVISIGMVI